MQGWKTFTLPKGWSDKKVLLFLQAPLTRIESGLSPKDANELLLNEVAVGDVYPNALGKLGKAGQVEHWQTFSSLRKLFDLKTDDVLVAEHFCQFSDEVIVPLFKNLGNMDKFPNCLVSDIKQQVNKDIWQDRIILKAKQKIVMM